MDEDAIDKSNGLHAPSAAARGAVTSEIVKTEAPATADGDKTPLMTAAQVAERWHVPVRTVYAWAKRNAIPHYRAGRLLRFDPIEVEEHFRRHGFADEVTADPDHPGESAFALLSA